MGVSSVGAAATTRSFVWHAGNRRLVGHEMRRCLLRNDEVLRCSKDSGAPDADGVDFRRADRLSDGDATPHSFSLWRGSSFPDREGATRIARLAAALDSAARIELHSPHLIQRRWTGAVCSFPALEPGLVQVLHHPTS